MTGGRLKRLEKYINKDEDFLFTYGDGVSNVNIKKLLNFHYKEKKNFNCNCRSPSSKVW